MRQELTCDPTGQLDSKVSCCYTVNCIPHFDPLVDPYSRPQIYKPGCSRMAHWLPTQGQASNRPAGWRDCNTQLRSNGARWSYGPGEPGGWGWGGGGPGVNISPFLRRKKNGKIEMKNMLNRSCNIKTYKWAHCKAFRPSGYFMYRQV
jgi:hypothetical protein